MKASLILLAFFCTLSFYSKAEEGWVSSDTVVENGAENKPEGGDVTLDGPWQSYDGTPLTVKRFITMERDGDIYKAEVYTPVLVRKGAVFLKEEQVSELMSIRKEIDSLTGAANKLLDSAKTLGDRYNKLMGEARAGSPAPVDIASHKGKVVIQKHEIE